MTDTNMPDRSFFRFTEKILKPIANFQPFIVFGYHGELQLLKNEGFVTSSPFVDESYDDVEDPVARFRAALSEFERLCALPREALEAMMLRLAPQMEENYARLWDAAKALTRQRRRMRTSLQSYFAGAWPQRCNWTPAPQA